MKQVDVKTAWVLFTILLYLIHNSISVPTSTGNSFVFSSTTGEADNESEEEAEKSSPTTSEPIQISKMQVVAKISNRYVHARMFSYVKNYAKTSKEATFSIVLPETAFISSFVMEINNKHYPACVKEKEEAEMEYKQAVASGKSAAHVAVSARDSNRFTVSVNLKPESKAIFYLDYEELLKRQDNFYELVINLHPGQPVKDFSVSVVIKESRPIINLEVPLLRSGNEIGNDNDELDPRAWISIKKKSAVVNFNPNVDRQKEFARILKTPIDEGLAAQFVVRYDVERDPQGGEVLIEDGYFVHFFAPTQLQTLPKHVVFVLDTSSSMSGQKIVQVRESMMKILEELNDDDTFQLVKFDSYVNVLDLDDLTKNINVRDSHSNLNSMKFKPPYKVSSGNNIKNAKAAIEKLGISGSTNIYGALEVGLHLADVAEIKDTHQPMIIFLTDGSPNTGRFYSTDVITTKISELNSGKSKTAIFTLGFGNSANGTFLQNLASLNNGFFRQIYEAADASLQLRKFYKLISSPLLKNVKFKYSPSTTSLTVTEFPMHFGGSDIVVAGCYSTPEFIPPTVEGQGKYGAVALKPTVRNTVSSVERLWAYLTVRQLLEQKELPDKDAVKLKEKALDLALQYKFVTSVSSLVVVKPDDESSVVDIIAAYQKTESTPRRSIRPIKNQGNGYSNSGFDRPFTNNINAVVSTSFFIKKHSIENSDLDREVITLDTPKTRPTSCYPVSPMYSVWLDAFNSWVSSISTTDTVKSIPWLKNVLTDGVISLTKGNYKLGLNETITDEVHCPKTPLGGSGHCALLHTCKQIHLRLYNKNIFEKHHCILQNEYAGICCPSYDELLDDMFKFY